MMRANPSAWDPAQTHRRLVEETRTTFVVRAGAGTGKTTVLLERLLSLIRSGVSRLDQIAAITFTERAAGELRVRLRAEIEAALDALSPERERRLFLEALGALERAPIATIHAFCAGILRDHPVEAGVDPEFTVLEEAAARLFYTQTWQEWLARELHTSGSLLKRALRLGLTLEHLEAAATFLLDHRDCLHLLPSPLPSPLPPFQETFKRAVEKLASLQHLCLDPRDRALEQIRLLTCLAGSWAEEGQGERLLAKRIPLSPKVGSRSAWQGEKVLGEVRSLLAHLAQEWQKAQRVFFHNLAAELSQWLCGYVGYCQGKKRERGLLDFTDLLLFTRDLLKFHPDVRHTLQQKYHAILVDEFQDTDPLQVEIVFFLAEAGARAKDWTEAEIQPGKLFVVGDPFQSIYRFRRADVAMYQQACAALGRMGEVATLEANFRTRAPLVDFFNETFSRLMSGASFPYVPLVSTRFEFHGKEVTCLPVPPGLLSSKPSRTEERQAEARVAAAFLKRVVEWGDLSLWGEERLRYRDIALLFRTYQAMEVYAEALRSLGVPHRVFGGRQFYRRPEIGMLLALLRSLENPWDREALVAVLRSPLFGFSDEDLFLFSTTGGTLNYTVAPPSGVHAAPRFSSAFGFLLEFHRCRNALSPAVLLEELYARSHLLPLLALLPQGEQAVANLLKVCDLARSCGPSLTLHAFVRFLDKMEREGWEEEAPLSEAGEEAVWLLTVHKAKGLEFPVVLLADATPPRRVRSPVGVMDRSAGKLAIRLGPRPLGCETLGWGELEEKERWEEEEEEKRLLYVALTRARDLVVIPLLPGKRRGGVGSLVGVEVGEDSYGKGIYPFGPAGPQVFIYDSRKLEIPPPSSPASFSLEGRERETVERYQAWQQRLQALKERGLQGGVVLDTTRLTRGSGSPLPLAGGGPLLQQGGKLPLGRLVYKALHADLGDPEEAEKLVQSFGVGEEKARQLLSWVQGALSSPALSRARSAEKCFYEVPFTYACGEGILEGVVDLVFVEEGEVVGVHFKAEVLAGELKEQCRRQALLSALALEALGGGLRVKEVVVLFLPKGEEAVYPWGEEAKREAQRWLRPA